MMTPELIKYVDSVVGTPYKTNGRTREDGLDCFGLALDFYRRFVGRELDQVQIAELPDDWFNQQQYNDYKRKLLIKHCSWLREPEPFCLVLMAPRGEAEVNHLGVYLGEDRVLNTTKKTGALLTKLSALVRAKRVRGYFRVE
jgi:cell wall-associated NlpC family hydrolase